MFNHVCPKYILSLTFLYLSLSLGYIDVVVDVVAGVALGTKAAFANPVSVRLQKLVEDVVGPLHLLLLSDT